jgi:hypothetical protein
VILVSTDTIPTMTAAPARKHSAPRPREADKKVLNSRDFSYLGCFRVPPEVGGWPLGGLALREGPDGAKTFFTLGTVREQYPLFELAPPDSLGQDVVGAPVASVVKAWGVDIYGSARRLPGAPARAKAETHGLFYEADRLFVAYDKYYHVEPNEYPTVLLATISGGDARANGPWFTTLPGHQTCGYFARIPDWFAEAYTNGRTLAVGAGRTSGGSSSSFGPCLAAVEKPDASNPPLTKLRATQMLFYPMEHRCPRDPDYSPLHEVQAKHANPRPQNGVGWWTNVDLAEACAWIDLADKHGVLFFGMLTQGKIWYGNSPDAATGAVDPASSNRGNHAERRVARWWIYDPMELAGVLTGAAEPWQVRAKETFAPRGPGGTKMNRCNGAAFDKETNTLFLCYPDAEFERGRYSRPVVHAWKVQTDE